MKRIYGVFSISFLLFGICFGIGEINIAYSPYTISQPGSYIVVKDLYTSSNGNGITISTCGVSIDLNGHGVYGPGVASINTADGIYSKITGTVAIYNGQISNFNGVGIYLPNAQVHLSKVNVTDNSQHGIWVDGGIIENCLVTNNGLNGIFTDNNTYPALISGNVVSYNCWGSENNPAVYGTQNCNIINNTISNNSSDGVYSAIGNVAITDNIVTNNHGSFANLSGVGILTYASNCQITGNMVSNNRSHGILLNGNGSNIKGNNVSSNGIVGIQVAGSCQIIGNIVYSNASGGIRASNKCTINNNDVSSNGLSGIFITDSSNNIQSNSIFSNVTGLNISTTGNFWAGNIFRSNTVSTSIVSGNTSGNGVTGGFNNLIVPYTDINFGIRQFAGFEMRMTQEAREAVLIELKW